MSGVIVLIALLWGLLLMSRRRSAANKGKLSDRRLITIEKIQIFIICLLSPVIGGAILYYGWRKKLPSMAKEANTLSFIAFGIDVAVLVLLVFLGTNAK